MAYVCELSPGHHVYLDNQGNQTIITTAMGLPGQQQQASNSMTTGPWTAPPEAYQSAGGAVFKLFTAQGELCVYIQGSSVSMTNGASMTNSGSMTEAMPSGAQQLSMQQTTGPSAQPMQPMSPMQPMQPMTMGNMQMTMNPMEMRMGNMELKMDSPNPAPQPAATRQFCSQCGAKVAAEDRFCSSCGHALS